MNREEIYSDIGGVLGVVPSFFERIPDSALELEWELYKRLQLEEGPIPNKYRELLGLAVSAVSKCHYCTFYHTEVGKLWGAKDAEIEEAVRFAMSSSGWSTYFDGLQFSFDASKEAGLMECMSHWLREGRAVGEEAALGEQLLRDLAGVAGNVPSPLRAMPAPLMKLEWSLFSRMWLEDGPIPLKYRHLMGIAIAGEVGSSNLAVLHTAFARAYGAGDPEIEAAVHYAKLTTGWSTYINGLQMDFEQFKDEVARACRYVREAQAAAAR